MPKLGLQSIVNSAAQYSIDIRLPGMLVAAVAHSPLDGATLLSCDRDAALSRTGVVRVVEGLDFVAIAARTYWQAATALQRAQVRWSQTDFSTAELRSRLHAAVSAENAHPFTHPPADGDLRVDATYEAPLLAHAALEPLNATAKVTRFSAEVCIDPLLYRRRLLSENSRALRVLDALERATGWKAARRQGRWLGVAYNEGFRSLTAQAVEVAPSPRGSWKIARAWVVVDCGLAINPNTITAQIEGGVLFGLSAVLFEEITYQHGEIEQCNFDRYRVLRMAEHPQVEVYILQMEDAEVGGIVEAGVPPAAPALANALFEATGVRVRSLPFIKSQLPLDYQ